MSMEDISFQNVVPLIFFCFDDRLYSGKGPVARRIRHLTTNSRGFQVRVLAGSATLLFLVVFVEKRALTALHCDLRHAVMGLDPQRHQGKVNISPKEGSIRFLLNVGSRASVLFFFKIFIFRFSRSL